MTTIRVLDPHEHDAGVAFYESQGYSGGIAPGDRALAAFDGDEIVGLVRVTEEHDLLVLRGMFIDEPRRGQGLGHQMLDVLVEAIGERTCWLVCYERVVSLYADFGFERVAEADAPPHLVERLKRYLDMHPDMLPMRRDPVS